MKICITGSSGLIGSTAAKYFLQKKNHVFGIDNNMRQFLFGKKGSTSSEANLLKQFSRYRHFNFDIRDTSKLNNLFKKFSFDAVIHCAGQPSHDKGAQDPELDFSLNSLVTFQVLEATRLYCPKAVFIYTSTNKVYGDNPNKIPFLEKKTRYIYKDQKLKGVDEEMSIDNCTHSFMGTSKLAADIYVQEYGKYFKLKTTSLRLGCITGEAHAGVKLHGFLSYLVKSIFANKTYEIIGYKGKQVRDQLHAYDLAAAFEEIIKKPNAGEVFNLGGGWKNNASILELLEIIKKKIGIDLKITYNPIARKGDHICYISNINKFKKKYPRWKITKNINQIVDELIENEKKGHLHF